MKPHVDYSLYLVTDRERMSSATLESAVSDAIKGGCTIIQLREKTAASNEFYEIALKVKQVTDALHVPLIINDRVDIALAVDAAGVHVGQSDIPAASVRKLIGPDKILGVSASHLEEALQAVACGADYIGVGAMFATDTKTDVDFTTMDELAQIRSAVALPIVVIGGISKETISAFHGSCIDGVAVVSAILSQPDIVAASKELKALFSATIVQ